MRFALLRRVIDLQRLDLALGVNRFAFLIHEVGLEPPHHDALELLFLGHDVPCEALIVEQLQQGGEGFLIAIVRRGGEEDAVLEMRGDSADEARALAF